MRLDRWIRSGALIVFADMHLVPTALRVAAWGISFAWVYKFVEAARGLAGIPNLLGNEYDAVPAGNPAVTIVVPARNEAAKVGICLESLLNQDYANLRVIGVDDRSTDETGHIMDAMSRGSCDRLEVLRIAELPANWLGKTHAMAVAAGLAIAKDRPDYLLFTDADIVFLRDAIRRALAYAEAARADHLVVLPTTIAKTPGEGMLLAYLQVMGLWAVRPWRVADPNAMRDAIGVGAFNLIRTSAYEQIGGFETVPMEILEDLDLGRRVKRAGLRQRVATAPGMVSVHWAAGASGIVTGMTKNLFAVFRFRPAVLIAAAAWIAVFCIGPVGFLAMSGMRLPGLLALIAVAGLYVLSSRTSRISWGFALLFPIAAAVTVYSMFRSMSITVIRRGVTWRGTFYPLKDLQKHIDRHS